MHICSARALLEKFGKSLGHPGTQILSLFTVWAGTWVFPGAPWNADFVAIYGVGAHLGVPTSTLERRFYCPESTPGHNQRQNDPNRT